jgi:uncharacterized damage-inducible protein DinB
MRWFNRTFPADLPSWMFPNIVERVRGTPARLEELLRNVPTSVITRRWNDTWSIQENAGHLLDLEGLWMSRFRDLQVGNAQLTEADLSNRQTWERNHNDASLAQILRSFRSAREELVGQLNGVDEAMMERTAIHPRLGNAMRLVDLAFFVAEHDDHHLARVTQLKHIFA